MPVVPTTRAEHRNSLKYKTSQKVTDNTTLDYYIDKAEIEVLAEFIHFHPGLMRAARDSGATDASGILLMDQGFAGIERLEDANDLHFPLIDTPADRRRRTGYFFAGFDPTTKKPQLQVMKDGAVHASTTLYWWNLKLVSMASGATDVSAVPDGYKECIDYLAAKKYWEDQGSSMQDSQARYWAREYEALLNKARSFWGNPTKDPEWTESVDPDAGEFGGGMVHRVS